MIYNKCKICDKAIPCYPSTYNKKVYCSKECRERLKVIEVNCLYCNDLFKIAQSKYNKWGYRGKCCSDDCFKEYQTTLDQKVKLKHTYKCDNCGKIFIKARNSKKYKFCSQECSRYYMVGDKANSYKGGTITTQGYKAIKIGNKYILEHRIIMEENIGRKLTRREQVHHIDGNKLNNDISNLDIIDISKHGRIHANERWNK